MVRDNEVRLIMNEKEKGIIIEFGNIEKSTKGFEVKSLNCEGVCEKIVKFELNDNIESSPKIFEMKSLFNGILIEMDVIGNIEKSPEGFEMKSLFSEGDVIERDVIERDGNEKMRIIDRDKNRFVRGLGDINKIGMEVLVV